MRRFQEQVEQKLAELKRTIRSFDKWAVTWSTLAEKAALPGHAAYAREKAEMYKVMKGAAERELDNRGYRALRESEDAVAVYVEAERVREVDFMKAAGKHRRVLF